MLAGLGREGGVVVGWNSGLEMCRRSSSTVRLGGGVCTGTYCRRNLRLRRVTLPEPSIRTLY